MFAIIGFIASAAVLCYLSLAWVVVAFNGCGTYNIGGVPNSTAQRIFILALGALLGYFWYLLIAAGPISIVVK